MIFLPVSKAPYKRTYKHVKGRGNEEKVRCGKCGRLVPKWKTFTTYQGFRLNDPSLRKQIDRRQMHFFSRRIRVCPKCARFYHIVDKGKSTRRKL